MYLITLTQDKINKYKVMSDKKLSKEEIEDIEYLQKKIATSN